MVPKTPELDASALVRALARAGIPCEVHGPGDAGEVATIKLKGARFELHQRSLPDVPERLLEVLSLHVIRSQFTDQGPTLLAITVPRLPKGNAKWADDLLAMQKAQKDKTPWVIVSKGGGFHAYLPNTSPLIITMEDEGRFEIRVDKVHVSLDRSTDVELAVLKYVLLNSSSDADAVRSVRNLMVHGLEKPESIQDLAQYLNVSRAAVYNATGHYIHRGWMQSNRGKIPSASATSSIVNWWLDTHKHLDKRSIAVAPIYESVPRTRTRIMDYLSRISDMPSEWAVTGWLACHLHKRLAVSEMKDLPVHVVASTPLRPLMKEWGLHEVARDQALFHLQQTSTPIATFSFAQRINGLPVVDLWETALSLVSDPHRGHEQAMHIAKDLFGAIR